MQHLHPLHITVSSRLLWPHSPAAGVAHFRLGQPAAASQPHHHTPVLVHVCLAPLWAEHVCYNIYTSRSTLTSCKPSYPAGCSGGFMPLKQTQCRLGCKGAAPQRPYHSTAGPGPSAVCGSRLMLCRGCLTAAHPPLPSPSQKGCRPGRRLHLSSPTPPPPPQLPQHQGGRTSIPVLQASLKLLLRPGLAASLWSWRCRQALSPLLYPDLAAHHLLALRMLGPALPFSN